MMPDYFFVITGRHRMRTRVRAPAPHRQNGAVRTLVRHGRGFSSAWVPPEQSPQDFLRHLPDFALFEAMHSRIHVGGLPVDRGENRLVRKETKYCAGRTMPDKSVTDLKLRNSDAHFCSSWICGSSTYAGPSGSGE
jgi:hypothetical protein